MTGILFYPLLTTAFYYLGAWAKITERLWRKAPRSLYSILICGACSGFWYGLAVGSLGAWRKWSFAGLPGRSVLTVLAVGFASLVWTPPLAVYLIESNQRLSDSKLPEDKG